MLQAVIDPLYEVRWKSNGQFYTLSSQQVIGLGQAVRAHVQSCYDREAELLADHFEY